MAKKLKAITEISDPLLDPYYITKDDYCYTVNIKIKSNKNHFRATGKNKSYSKSISFHARFDQALKSLSQEQLNTKKKYKIREFINEYKSIENKIKNFTDGIRSTI